MRVTFQCATDTRITINAFYNRNSHFYRTGLRYSRVRYRSSNFCPSVRQHLRQSLVFSTSVIAASLKLCIVIVPDIPLSTHLNPVSLTYISQSTDFENFYVKVLSTFTSKFGFLDIRDSCKSETLHSNCP